jgi:hypothetical protein
MMIETKPAPEFDVPEPPKKNLTIVSAVHHADQACLELMVVGENGGEPYFYALYENDRHGDAPRLREILAEQEITVEERGATVALPEPEPTAEQKRIAELEARLARLEGKLQ